MYQLYIQYMEQPKPFDNTTRLGVDSCVVDQRSMQNTQTCNYNLQNYFLAECSMKQPIEFATSQPAVNYKGGHLGAGGCNVDVNSELLLGALQTHPRSKVVLYQRPYSTIPYLGKGSADSVDESRLQQGERGVPQSVRSVFRPAVDVEKVTGHQDPLDRLNKGLMRSHFHGRPQGLVELPVAG